MTTPQIPLNSGFDATATAADVIAGVDLTGKVAIVTGGHSGLGLEAARNLASAGARVIVPARDAGRARAAIDAIGGGIEVQAMDLNDPASIDAFARRFVRTGLKLHLLINSAGIMALPELTRDARGREMQFATNHLGHFQLTARLWPALARAQGARVVSVSSMGHRFSPVVFDDVDFASRPYDPWLAYGQSKTANVLFAVALDARGAAQGVRAFSLHPGGIVDTNLAKHVPVDTLKAFGAIDAQGDPVIDPVGKDLKSVPQGAATYIWCATSERLNGKGGVFCLNSDIAPLLPADTTVSEKLEERLLRKLGVMPYAVDRDAAGRLWNLSEELTGVRFAI